MYKGVIIGACMGTLLGLAACGKHENPLLNDNAVKSIASIIDKDKVMRAKCRQYYLNPIDPTKEQFKTECDDETKETFNKYKKTELLKSARVGDLRDSKFWELFYKQYPLADMFG